MYPTPRCRHNRIERDELLIEKNVFRALLHYCRDVLHELLTGSIAILFYATQYFKAIAVPDALANKIDKQVHIVCSEYGSLKNCRRKSGIENRISISSKVIVKISTSTDVNRIFVGVTCFMIVTKKLCIAPHLHSRMENISQIAADKCGNLVFPFTQGARFPLLQLNRNNGRRAIFGKPTQKTVHPLRREWKLELEHHTLLG